MELAIRMKTVARLLIFTASLLVWLVALSFLIVQTNFDIFGMQEGWALVGAVALGAAQTWIIAAALKT